MTDLEQEAGGPKSGGDLYMSTSCTSNIKCGICGATLRNLPEMYEKMDIDWRCGKCLRRDKPVLEDHIS